MPKFVPAASSPDHTGQTPAPKAAAPVTPVPVPAATTPATSGPFATDNTVPDWSEAVVGAAASQAEDDAHTEAKGASKLLVALVAAVGLALIAAGVFMFLTKSSDAPTPTPAPVVTPTASPSPTAQPSLIAMPSLVGLSLEDAKTLLAQSGLVAGEVTRQPFDAALDTVLAQTPKEAVQVAPGTVVDLVVSAVGEVAVPDVKGLNREEATAALAAASFKVRFVARPAPSMPPGTAVGQTPRAGVTAEAGATVTVAIASTDKQIPDVVGRKQAIGVQMLRNNGFLVKVTEVPRGQAGVILTQTPKGAAKPGTRITITVGAPR